jgi:hypothetical protein
LAKKPLGDCAVQCERYALTPFNDRREEDLQFGKIREPVGQKKENFLGREI